MHHRRVNLVAVQTGDFLETEDISIGVRTLTGPCLVRQKDLIVFPELTITLASILNEENVAEEAGKGPTFKFFSSLAKELRSFVIAGFAEKNNGLLYNSLYVIDRQGALVLTHRATQLPAENHRNFAVEKDPKFSVFEIKTLAGATIKVAPVFAYDLLPKSKFEEFPFADFAIKNSVDVVAVSMNWPKKLNQTSQKDILEYFIMRMTPMTDIKLFKMMFRIKEGAHPPYKNWALVVANRVGNEMGTVFAGGSGVVGFQPAKVYGQLDGTSERLLEVNLML